MGQLKTPFASEETHNKPICPDYADDCGTADSQNAYAETLKILNIKLELNPQFPWKLAGLSLFSRCYGMPVKKIAVDSSANVIVTGPSWNGTHYDYSTVACSSAGVPLWTNRYNGTENGDDYAQAIAVDGNGNVFVSGQSFGSGSYGYATVAYSGVGAPLWTNRCNGPGAAGQFASAIAVDRSGNVFVAATVADSSGYTDYATVAYSGAGVPLWTNRYNGTDIDDYATAIAVDRDGNVFVTGQSYAGGIPASRSDYVTVAYSGAGVPLWTKSYNATGFTYDGASAIAIDRNSNVFVTGISGSGAGYGYATVAYSGAGVPLWTKHYNGPGNYGGATAIAVDRSGNVFVTGRSRGISGDYDYGTVAYSGAGMPLWTRRFNGSGKGDDGAFGIAVDSSDNVFVTGYSDVGNTSYDYVTIKYSSSIPRVHLDFQTLNNQLGLSWTNSTFTLQSATDVTGPFTNIPGATSPYTNSLTASQQYFRLMSP